MTFQTLRRGNTGQDVALLQSELNKVGAMLVPDGDFGPDTERGVAYAQDVANQPMTGVADPHLWGWLGTQPKPFAKLHTNGVAFIAKEETGGLHYYEMVAQWPHFPGHASGITIGVGYDLRFNTEDDFKSSWSSYLPATHINELAKDIDRKGSKSRAMELRNKGVEIPFKFAWPVLIHKTLPRFYQNTESIYPSINNLPDLCRSVLVSIVFNRGSKLSGSTRREMKEIQRILETADAPHMNREQKKDLLQNVEEEILSMKRLWARGSGLLKRRQDEANLWREGLRSW